MSFTFTTNNSTSAYPKPSKRTPKRRRRTPRCLKKCRATKLPTTTATATSKGVAERLDALKELIPWMGDDNATADEVFEGTADYILLLRTRVEILKHLVELYGNNEENAPGS